MNNTKIEWTECTWNPVTGCTKISAGCENCYAEKFAKRLNAMGNRRYKNEFNVTVHDDLIDKPLNWKKSKMIFVNSMSDLFHESIPDETIIEIFNTMNAAHWHVFQVLTKRSQRMLEMSERLNWTENIWMGVSIEDRNTLYRYQDLIQTGAYIKFISAEPLLEDLGEIDLINIDWLIVGGESGPNSRILEEEWIINLKNIADASNTPFFFKQWGGKNKKKSGSKLLGAEYKNYPHK